MSLNELRAIRADEQRFYETHTHTNKQITTPHSSLYILRNIGAYYWLLGTMNDKIKATLGLYATSNGTYKSKRYNQNRFRIMIVPRKLFLRNLSFFLKNNPLQF